jgi:hypothetical protein
LGALVELYAFSARAEGMLENLFRDEVAGPMVAERFTAFRGYFASALVTGLNLRCPRIRCRLLPRRWCRAIGARMTRNVGYVG